MSNHDANTTVNANADVKPLDESLFKPTPKQVEFLRAAITDDEEELRRRVMEVQKECVFLASRGPFTAWVLS